MDLAWISLAALLLVIVVSCTTTVNPGFLSIALAWIIGVYVAEGFGTPLGLKVVISGFPSDLFLTLVGVTLLFTQAHENGTLDRVAHLAVRGCRGNVGLIPVAFFFLSLILASIGAGNIAASALISPLAMAAAGRGRIPAFLMTLMVTHGCIAGAVSPFAPTGIIANDLMSEKLGLPGYEWHVYGANLVANFLVAFLGYFLFGGWKLFGRSEFVSSIKANESEFPVPAARLPNDDGGGSHSIASGDSQSCPAMAPRHWLTLGVIAGLILAVIFAKVHVGMGAFVGAVVLTMLRATDERKSMQAIPWSVILMVCGVTVLTALLERTGGLNRFAEIVSKTSNPQSITGIIGFLTGVISVYSSTSGVVLPAFVPMVPSLVKELGGGDPLAIVLSIIVCGHLVDSSPLSTVGALCIASASPSEDRRLLFNRLLIWGLSMAVIGAVLCFIIFGLLGMR